jgi:hypothetical protein
MLEIFGTVFILVIIVSTIVGIVCLVDYFRDINYRIEDLEFRNKRDNDRRWNEMSSKTFKGNKKDSEDAISNGKLGPVSDDFCCKCGKSNCESLK